MSPNQFSLSGRALRFFRILAASAYKAAGGSTIDLFSLSDRQPRTRSKDIFSYLQYTKENEWLMICVLRIIDAISQASWQIVDETTGDPVEDKSLPVYTIFKNPNNHQVWLEFIEQLIFFWLPGGNAFILLKDQSLAGNPTKLELLRPERIKIIPDPIEFVKGYEYFIYGNVGVKNPIFTPKEIVHVRFGNPTDPHWGMGRIEASPRVFESDSAAAEYNHKFFSNDATPGFILESEGNIDPEVRTEMRKDWEEKFMGFKRAHGLGILEGGLKAKPLGLSPKESSFIETRKGNREAILGLMGVQPMVAGITEDANRASAFVQDRLFVKWAITPLLMRLEAKMSIIAKLFGNFAFQFEQQTAEDNELDAQIGGNYLEHGAITPNELRYNYAGLPKIKNDPAMDKFYIAANLLPIDADISASLPFGSPSVNPEGPVPVPGGGDQPSGAVPLPGSDNPAASSPVDPSAGDSPVPLPGAKEAMPSPKGTPLQRRVLRHVILERLHVQRTLRIRISNYFFHLGKEVERQFLEGSKSFQSVHLGMNDAVAIAGDEKSWMRLTRSIYIDSLKEEYVLTAELLGYDPKQTDFAPGDPRFDRRVHYLVSKVTSVPKETSERIAQVITEGLDLGLSPQQIASGDEAIGYNGISGTFDEFQKSRAMLIARTESARVLDQANTAVYADMGVQVVDVIGCEDNEIMPGQRWGCNSQGIPIVDAAGIEFHPNHTGTIVPRVGKSAIVARVLTSIDSFDINHSNRYKPESVNT